MPRLTKIAVAVMSSSIAASMPAAAQSQETEEAHSGWEVGTTLYVWGSGLKGDIRAIETAEPVGVDLSFADILDHLKFAGMGAIQARKGRFVMVADMSYVSLGGSKDLEIRDVDLLEGEIDAATFTASALAGYRLADRSPITFDLMAGGRINSVTNKLELSGPLRSVEGKDTKTWIDPIIGAHASVPISSKISLAAYGDVGGFGLSSDFTWQLMGLIQYDFDHHWRASAGWRHYAVDYDRGEFLYDVSLSGPIIGIRYAM